MTKQELHEKLWRFARTKQSADNLTNVVQQLITDQVNEALTEVSADLKPLEPIDVGALTGGTFGVKNSGVKKYISSQTLTEAQGAYLMAHNQLVNKILSAIEQIRKDFNE